MKFFAILLMCFTSFAFAEEPNHQCDDPAMALDPKCKDHGKDKKLCGKPKWDNDNADYDDDFGRHCNPIHCIAIYDEKQKKDVHRWSCSENPPTNRQCTGKAVRSCHGLKGDECTASFIKGDPGAQCGLLSDGTCSNSGGECNG